MNSLAHIATEIVLNHADTMPPHLTAGTAFVAFVGSVEMVPRPEFTDMLDTSWHVTARATLDSGLKNLAYVTDETIDFFKHLKLERSPSEYNTLRLGFFRTIKRYLTTLQSDPAEAWVTSKDIKRLEQAQIYATELKT